MHEYTLGRQIATLARAWRLELDRRLMPCGRSQARYVLMVYLAEAEGPLAQTDLAERAGITGPTLVRHVDQLETQQLVSRTDATGDRRVKNVSLTEQGWAAYRQADDIATTLRDEITKPFGHSDLSTTQQVLRDLSTQFESIRGKS